ncbi:MAG: hypothetical protein FJ191_00185 [Gammaproteobacteria bacterium]|nr:hypothetical protein [Gammaproteobacteria bacterium]
MITRVTALAVLVSVLALGAAPAALAQHRVEVTDLVITQGGRPVSEVSMGSRVTIECSYQVDIDRGFPPRPDLPDWSGELSVDGSSVRVFDGERRTRREVVRADWAPESVGSATVRCLLDRQRAFRNVDGSRTREVRLRVVREPGAVVQCVEDLTASVGLSSTTRPQRTRAGQASLNLALTHSRPEGDVAVCYYASRNRDVQDFRVEVECRHARRASTAATPQADARANTSDPRVHRYLCGAD